jgi:hypothetical protein
MSGVLLCALRRYCRELISIGIVAAESPEREVVCQADGLELQIGEWLEVSRQQAEHDVISLRQRIQQIRKAGKYLNAFGTQVALQVITVSIESGIQQSILGGTVETVCLVHFLKDLRISLSGK